VARNRDELSAIQGDPRHVDAERRPGDDEIEGFGRGQRPQPQPPVHRHAASPAPGTILDHREDRPRGRRTGIAEGVGIGGEEPAAIRVADTEVRPVPAGAIRAEGPRTEQPVVYVPPLGCIEPGRPAHRQTQDECTTNRVDVDTVEDHLVRVCGCPLAVSVKRADIADNRDPRRIARLPDPSLRRRLTEKYDRYLALLDRLAPSAG
jgi:hypothetical protein